MGDIWWNINDHLIEDGEEGTALVEGLPGWTVEFFIHPRHGTRAMILCAPRCGRKEMGDYSQRREDIEEMIAHFKKTL